jgi:Tol biopolymer transport system component
MALTALALALYGLGHAATAGVDGSPGFVSYSVGVGARAAIGTGRGLCIARPDGRASRRLTRKDDRNPSWAPGGRRVAFARYRRGGDSVSDILVADPEGRVIRNLSRGWTTESADPDWSPDGRSIAYVAAHRGSGIIVVDRHGNRRRIVESAPSGWFLGSPT